tara:strand:- start:465 stop:662 length:198 start_codon:yes stop_codon:yes gene_type:complete
MKYFTITILALILSACTGPIKQPGIAFGKKCAVQENGQVTYSYIWFYDAHEGLNANKKECEEIDD